MVLLGLKAFILHQVQGVCDIIQRGERLIFTLTVKRKLEYRRTRHIESPRKFCPGAE